LWRRQYQTSLLQQTERQLETLEALTSSIEFALIEKDVLFGLQQGNQVLKEIHKGLTLESVQHLMDDTAEGIHYQEISAMLAGVMTNDDEDAVEEELAAMEREIGGMVGEEEEEAEVVVVVPDMPSAPRMSLEPSEGVKAQKAKERARARKAEPPLKRRRNLLLRERNAVVFFARHIPYCLSRIAVRRYLHCTVDCFVFVLLFLRWLDNEGID
jgi:charged multivesicular body protein 6